MRGDNGLVSAAVSDFKLSNHGRLFSGVKMKLEGTIVPPSGNHGLYKHLHAKILFFKKIEQTNKQTNL